MVYPDLHKLFSPPYIYMVLGMVFVLMGAISMSTGKALTRGAIIDHDKEPKLFWWIVVLDYVFGVCFIGYFMYLGTTVGYPPLR